MPDTTDRKKGTTYTLVAPTFHSGSGGWRDQRTSSNRERGKKKKKNLQAKIPVTASGFEPLNVRKGDVTTEQDGRLYTIQQP